MANTYLAWDGEEYEWPPPAGWALRSDGRYWPADQGPATPAPTPAPPPAATPPPPAAAPPPNIAFAPAPAQKSGSGCGVWALIIIGVLLVTMFGGCVLLASQLEDAVDEIGEQLETGGFVTEDASLDQDTCEVKDGRARVMASATNTYSEEADLRITARFLDEDGLEIDGGTGELENLGPGETGEVTVGGNLASFEDGRNIECELVSAFREPQFLD